MLLLNRTKRSKRQENIEISIHLMLLLNQLYGLPEEKYRHFNTSYVVIKLLCCTNYNRYARHFNTSYVVIKRKFMEFRQALELNFNTSYVVIKHTNQINSV